MTRKNDNDVAPAASKTQVLLAESTLDLVAGSLVVICAAPGFKRAGIEHERLKVYADGELTPKQISQMRREPKLTLIEVG